jgi:hypothetical protein
VFEGEGALVEEEGEAVGGLGLGEFGIGDQRGGGAVGAVDHVEDEVLGGEGGGWDEGSVFGFHAEGGGVDDEVDVGEFFEEMIGVPG